MIPAADRRGRGFSPHSARKFFATTLTQMGVHARLIDVLMRHTSGVQGRYVDIPLKEQAHALKDFPALFPEFGTLAVDARPQIAESNSASHVKHPEPNYVPCSVPHGHDSQSRRSASRAGDAVGFDCSAPPSGDSASASGLKDQAENSGYCAGNSTASTSDAIADMLESVARVLRSTRNGMDSPPPPRRTS